VLLLADVAAGMPMRPAELPLGIVLASFGAPVLLRLVIRQPT
jgi:ABC-type cobalamin transport system permease subunit